MTASDKTSGKLNTEANFHHAGEPVTRPYRAGDDLYEALIDSHQGLSDEQSQMLNARLILLLANHIGDLAVLRQALAAARESI
ncbi:DUF2783 domain-containing protein [Marinobacterium jannaschii]|uniref:DUF2783 domain-containing protein n=1 Tax=Marinobacterium jannaschii TaxID=64970 RepID=UPI000485F2D5|nr:DUF2783 domain-containing protein [Marinobacterium jannaschii]